MHVPAIRFTVKSSLDHLFAAPYKLTLVMLLIANPNLYVSFHRNIQMNPCYAFTLNLGSDYSEDCIYFC